MTVYEKYNRGGYENPIAYSPETRTQYNTKEAEIYATFKQDLEKQFGITHHPKKISCSRSRGITGILPAMRKFTVTIPTWWSDCNDISEI